MIKKQQKWIALLVTCTFIWLLQVSTMPVAAAGAPEQISAASTEQAPDFIEEEEEGVYKPKKSSILPIILIGVGVVAAAAILFLVVLKTKYDITGEWQCNRVGNAGSSTRYLTFTGDKKTGSVRIDIQATWGNDPDPDSGAYTVDGKAVSFNQYWPSNHTYEYNYVGNFTDKDTISGTYTMSVGGPDSGTWTATRRVTAATAPHQVAAQNSQDIDSKRRQQR